MGGKSLEQAPHPNPLPAGGERESTQQTPSLSVTRKNAFTPHSDIHTRQLMQSVTIQKPDPLRHNHNQLGFHQF